MTLVNGVSQMIALDGTLIQKVPSNYIVAAKDFNFINTKAGLTPEQAIVIEGLYTAALTGFIDLNAKGVRKIEWEDTRRLAGVNEKYTELVHKLSEESIFLIKQNLSDQKQKRRKQEKQYKQIRKNAESLFKGLLGSLVGMVVDFAKSQINKLLPDFLSFDVDITQSEDGSFSFGGLSVGDLKYNSKDNSISYGGDLFNAAAQQGLNLLNEQLPDFLQVSLNSSSIGVGGVSVDFDELFKSGKSFQLSESLSVKAIGEQITVFLGDLPYNIATKTNLLSSGLDSLNRILPVGIKASAQFKPGSLLPTIGLGPLSLDLSTGDLAFDAAGAKGLLTNQLESRVFNQLPAPLAAVGRAVWDAVDLGAIIGQDKKEVKVTASDSLVVNGLLPTNQSLTPTFNV